MLPHLVHGTKQKNKTSHIIDSISLGFANGDDGLLSPLDAPDADYLHWIDFSDAARVIESGGKFVFTLCPKTGVPIIDNSYSGGGSSPLIGGLINALAAGDYDLAVDRFATIKNVTDANLRFKYPSMTIFFIVQPKYSTTQGGFVISDYGGSSQELIYVRIGDTTNLKVTAAIRDASNTSIIADSGATLLSLDTDYLIVAKLDGTNRQVDLWIDGANNAYTDSNGAYDNTTTWEGAYASNAYATFGALSEFQNQSFKGYIGSMFITKTALSNADINKYANWMAAKWGTTWVNI